MMIIGLLTKVYVNLQLLSFTDVFWSIEGHGTSVSKRRVQCMMPCHPHTLLCMTNPAGRDGLLPDGQK